MIIGKSPILFVDLAAFTLFIAAFILYITYKRRSPEGSSAIEYMLMGRSLSLPMFVITLVATWYSGIFGVTQISYDHGIYNFITQGVFWYLAAIFFAYFIARNMDKISSLTLAEAIKNRFGQNASKVTAILLVVKSLPIPYAMAMGLFIASLTGLTLSTSIIIGSTFVTIYCLKGGMRGTFYTDICQFILMFISMSLVAIISYNTFGGLEYLQANLPASHFTLEGNHNISTVILWLFIAFSTTILSPVFYQRCMAAKSSKIAFKGILISVIFWFCCDILTTSLGLYARAYLQDSNNSTAFMQYSLMILPEGLRGFFLASFAIVLFSALDSYLFITSSTLYYDISSKKYLDSSLFRKFTVIVTGIITTFLAINAGSKLEKVWLMTESLFLASALLPIILAFTTKKRISDSYITKSMLLSFATVSIWEGMELNKICEGFYIGFLISAIILLPVILRPKEKTIS